MIHWLDEPIVHSVLSGLLLLGVTGVLWSIYVRLWQLLLWEICKSAIEAFILGGFQIKTLGFRVQIEAVHPNGRSVIWRGGLIGEYSSVDGADCALITQPKDI